MNVYINEILKKSRKPSAEIVDNYNVVQIFVSMVCASIRTGGSLLELQAQQINNWLVRKFVNKKSRKPSALFNKNN
jgi:hypothetical protein